MAGSERTDQTASATAPAASDIRTGSQDERGAVSDASTPSAEAVARHNIRFDATGEIAYHSLMESAFDRWHRIIMATIIVSGTASVGAIATLMPPAVALVISALAPLLIVLVSTLDFVFDLPGQARLHRDLKGKMYEILAELETCGDASIPEMRAKMQRVYAMQPPSLRYAQSLAYNQAVDATYSREVAKLHYEPVPHVKLNPLAWVMRVDRSWAKARQPV